MDKGLRADLTAAGADFDVTLEKRLMGNEDLYEKCLFMFADSRSTLDNFESFLEKKEYEKAFDEIHAIKGTAANVGLIRLQDQAEMNNAKTFEERLALLEGNMNRGMIPSLEIVNEALRFNMQDDARFEKWCGDFRSECETVIELIESYRK